MPQQLFQFKHFSIKQDQCAMKVGTDGVLLGCFVKPGEEQRVLDIGTGTGLLALMLAQKMPETYIDAIEIDELAVEQARQNMANSPWGKRIQVIHESLQSYANHVDLTYDLIVCNPPFFKAANKSKGNNTQHPDEQRSKARFTDFLPFNELVLGIDKLLSPDGCVYLVLPVQEGGEITDLFQSAGFYLTQRMQVIPKAGSSPNRWLMRWERKQTIREDHSLILYHADSSPTEDYIAFTKDFYLWTKFNMSFDEGAVFKINDSLR